MNEQNFNDINEQIEDVVKHYGVIGMKWGVRRGSSSASRKSGQKTPNPRRMSNKELNSRLKRLRLEDEYKRLSDNRKPKISSSIDTIVKTIGTVATLSTAAVTIYNNLDKITKAVNSAKK